MALLLGNSKLLAHLVNDLLANGSVIAVLALLDEALLVGLLTTALSLRGNHLSLALVSPFKFVLDHLQSELSLAGGLLLESLLDRRGCTVVKSLLDLDLEADRLVDVAGAGSGCLVVAHS